MQFLDSLIGRDATIKTQRSLFHNHIKDLIQPEDNYSVEYINQAILIWKDKGLSAGTIRGLAYLFFKYIKWKTGKDLYDRRVIGVINRMEQQKTVQIWTPEETKIALESSRYTDAELYSMLVFTLSTGCRKGEMMAITCDDVDFIKGTLIIQRGTRQGLTKNGKSRIIPMTKQLEEVMSARYIIGKNEWNRCFLVSDPNPRLKQLCESAGIPSITWHALRHLCLTRLLEARISPKKVAYIAGSTVTNILETYWNVGSAADLESIDLGIVLP